MKELRAHQQTLLDLCLDVLKGKIDLWELIVAVTPGGGKSLLPIILARFLIPHIADKICWVVPRDNLRHQGEHNFIEPEFIDFLDHKRLIRRSGNDVDPSRGTDGYITTYQSVTSDPILHWAEFDRHRYILFLDEPHHVRRGGPWEASIRKMIAKSVLTVYASGTFERGDKNPIAFLPYLPFGKKEVLDLTSTPNRQVITYSRTDAINEQAIIPLNFEMLDARAEWVDTEGTIIEAESLNENDRSKKEYRAALRTALTTEYANQLLAACVTQWVAHRKTIYKLAKLLVVAPDIKTARRYKKYLDQVLGLKKVLVATSDDKNAQKYITLYKTSPHHNILITVGMAYEGLDVKEITFVACLTFIRSKPWLEQCFARANRNAQGKKYGIVWGPRDHFFLQVADQIKAQQTEAAVYRPRKEGPDEPGQGWTSLVIAGISSEATEHSAYDMLTGKNVNPAETEVLHDVASRVPSLNGASTIQLKLFANELVETGLVLYSGEAKLPEPKSRAAPILTPKEQELILKKKISKWIRGYCIARKIDHWIPNREIKAHFGKSQTTMTVPELTKVWAHVQKVYKFQYSK